MKIYPIVEHEAADERMKRKAQSAKKMMDEHYPLAGLWSGDDLLFGWKPVDDLLGQMARFPKFLDVFLRDGGGHPLAMHSQSGHGWSSFWEWSGSKLR